MAWEIYTGGGVDHDYMPPEAPPWRKFPVRDVRLAGEPDVRTHP